MMLKEGGEGGLIVSVNMSLIFPEIVWMCFLRRATLQPCSYIDGSDFISLGLMDQELAVLLLHHFVC